MLIESESSSEPENKRIFKYFNGSEWVYEDPFEIEFRLNEAEELEDMDLMAKWLSAPKDDNGEFSQTATDADYKLYQKACHRLIPIYRKGFALKPFDGSTDEGRKALTSEEVLNLYADFIIWRNGLKKNTE